MTKPTVKVGLSMSCSAGRIRLSLWSRSYVNIVASLFVYVVLRFESSPRRK